MTTALIMPTTGLRPDEDAVPSPDEAQLAVAAFLARYSGRTLEAHRHDLRYLFQWATDQHLTVLGATRAPIDGRIADEPGSMRSILTCPRVRRRRGTCTCPCPAGSRIAA